MSIDSILFILNTIGFKTGGRFTINDYSNNNIKYYISLKNDNIPYYSISQILNNISLTCIKPTDITISIKDLIYIRNTIIKVIFDHYGLKCNINKNILKNIPEISINIFFSSEISVN